jgi:hypothetical protein
MSQRRRRPRNGSFHQGLTATQNSSALDRPTYASSNSPTVVPPSTSRAISRPSPGRGSLRLHLPAPREIKMPDLALPGHGNLGQIRSLRYDKPFSASRSVLIACKGDQDVARNEKIVAGFGDDEGSGRKSVCGIGWKSGGFGLWDFRERQNWPLRRSHHAPCTASGAGALHGEAVRLMLPASRGMKMQIPAYRCMLAPPSETSMPANG